MNEAAIGIDIGGTGTVFGLVTRGGKILAEGAMATRDYPQIENFVEALANRLEDMIEALNIDLLIKGVGIGAPNGNYFKGTFEHAPNLSWKGIVPLARMMEERLQKPVFVTNDANAAAVGEMVYGGARNLKDFVVITLGTGLGSGFVAGGQLIYGAHGHAGEMGHMAMVPNGRLCGCGRRGCLETYVSATGFMRTVREMLAGDDKSELNFVCPPDELTSAQVSNAAQNGDSLAIGAFEQTADMLGLALANMMVITAPQTIFLFGGFVNAGPVLWESIEKAFKAYVHPIYRDKVDIQISQLQNENAAVLGSSALVWQEMEREN